MRGGTRALLFVVLALVSVAGNLFVWGTGDAESVDMVSDIAADALQLGLVGLVVLALRRRLLANRWGRRAVAFLFVAGAGVTVAGTGVWLRRGTELDQTIGRDVVLGCVFAAVAITLTPRAWIAVACAGLATLVGSAWPDFAPALTFLTIALGVIVVVSESIWPSRGRDAA